ncbi:MAG: hypothetical protein ABW217_23180 [Polyangiaceae bacterium]
MNLTVATGRGCQSLQLKGVATEPNGRLVVYSPAAIDFGSVVIGGTSEPRTITIVTQYASDMPPNTFTGFSAVDPTFEIVSAPPGGSQPASCEPLEINVRFRAPSTPGLVESWVSWGVRTDLPEGAAEGTVLLPVYGRAVEVSN